MSQLDPSTRINTILSQSRDSFYGVFIMAGQGGKRSNAGAKKGQFRIHVNELRTAIENKIGMDFAAMLAITQEKLFNDFKSGENVREYIMFTDNMSKRILADQIHEIEITDARSLTKEDIDNRINNLLSRAALSVPYFETPADPDEIHGETH